MIFNKDYVEKMKSRTRRRIDELAGKIAEVSPGKKMPEESQISIGSGKQMFVAVLFLDICGYSVWRNGNFEEQKKVLAAMNLFMSEMLSIVKDHDGYFEKNTGDGLMAYFGTETINPEKSVKDAVDAALSMHYFNANILRPSLSRTSLPLVRFRVGIDYGPVTIARVGVRGDSPIVAIGASANIACKLLNVAQPEEVLVGQDVVKHLPAYYRQYCQLTLLPTKHIYVQSGHPYFAYKYIGRWRIP